MQKLLYNQKDSLLNHVLLNVGKYQVQVLYTQIDRDKNNFPSFKSYTLGVDPDRYYYPASSIKLPTAAAALEKINNLQVAGLTRDTPMRTDSAYARQTRAITDSTSPTGLPSVGHYIKKILLVSDNDAYNRLYEFVGQQTLNETLHQKGYSDARIIHRLSVGDSGERTRYTNPVTFYKDGEVIYKQPLVYNPKTYPNKLKTTSLGVGYYQDGKLVSGPMDFSDKNFITIASQQAILKSLLFPETVPQQQRFNLTAGDYAFLYQYMGLLPGESNYPAYNSGEYHDSYAKFLLFGSEKEPLPKHIRSFNKIGDAYGFLIDNAYIVDFENKVEFMLTAVILVNETMIFNTEDYQYDTVGLPFMKKLGQAVYQHELKRKRKYKPDLSRFEVVYQQP
ncbi:serine hydrolase [uncultured Pontibacter sp.]|uniref:serine hydrolase n=1 Tax=uncultured Pontibacter sp. TaxID=453356 RepID=UPI002615EBF6|nr:serine hydrolase [uncultured Pontibacter sp.]